MHKETGVCVFVTSVIVMLSFVSCKPLKISEENWNDVLQGEWMVEFMAPWCPACRAFTETWEKFSGWSNDLDIKVGVVDVTENPGIQGRFVIGGIPTVYHIKDGEFRRYTGGRKETELVSFVDDKKWKEVEAIPWYFHPSSIQGVQFWKNTRLMRKVRTEALDIAMFYTLTSVSASTAYIIFLANRTRLQTNVAVAKIMTAGTCAYDVSINVDGPYTLSVTQQMSALAQFFKLALVFRDLYNMMTKDYGIPEWVCYVLFAIGTIVLGLILGLLIVLCCDMVFPTKSVPTYSPPPSGAQGDGSQKEEEDADGEESETDIIDDTKNTEDDGDPKPRRRKVKKAD